jgi:hypothetical protein
METKICSKCREDKNICNFYKNRNECKECKKKKSMLDYNSNKEKYRTSQLLYRESNKETINEKNRIYYYNNHTILREKQKKYRDENIEKEKERNKSWRINNKNLINNYRDSRRKNEPLYKITENIRRRINKFFKSKNIEKNNKTFDIVGCSPEFLKEYIENKFTEGMSWDLMGKHIHIDHIIPLSSAKTEEDVYKLCHYTNLQPLWAEDNLKKSSKII